MTSRVAPPTIRPFGARSHNDDDWLVRGIGLPPRPIADSSICQARIGAARRLWSTTTISVAVPALDVTAIDVTGVSPPSLRPSSNRTDVTIARDEGESTRTVNVRVSPLRIVEFRTGAAPDWCSPNL